VGTKVSEERAASFFRVEITIEVLGSKNEKITGGSKIAHSGASYFELFNNILRAIK
jgi:hypothetical protein